jgi:hypothetical protein
LHHIIDIPMFAIPFDLVCSLACFWLADCRVESELPENFQDINFEESGVNHGNWLTFL